MVSKQSITMQQARRSTILELYRAGHSATTIVKLLHYPKSTIHDVINRYNETGVDTGKPQKCRSDCIRTPRLVAGLKRSVDARPGTTMKKLAAKRNVSFSTIQRAIKYDLQYKSYQLRVRHLLTEVNWWASAVLLG